MMNGNDMIWKMRDGTKIRVGGMEPSHALNAYEFMQRRAKTWAWQRGMQELRLLGSVNEPPDCVEDNLIEEDEKRMAFPHAHLDCEPIMRALFMRALDGVQIKPFWEGKPPRQLWAVMAMVLPGALYTRIWRTTDREWAQDYCDRNGGPGSFVMRDEYVNPRTGRYQPTKEELREQDIMTRALARRHSGMRV